jgi:hypothetical protein
MGGDQSAATTNATIAKMVYFHHSSLSTHDSPLTEYMAKELETFHKKSEATLCG